jgi:Tfp pilus assembly protein PilX
MRRAACPRRQGGATLVIGLILLVFITLMVTTAFSLSTTNLRMVGNMQLRDEAVAAANAATETVLGSAFTSAPTAQEINIDIDNDAVTDYVVSVAQPSCVRATLTTAATPSSLSLPSMSTAATWSTLWDIDATVTDTRSGTAVRVRSGARVNLSQAQKNSVCP